MPTDVFSRALFL